MNAIIFKEQVERYIDEISELISKMPYKGDSECESQKICLMNQLNQFSHVVNGVEDSDFVDDDIVPFTSKENKILTEIYRRLFYFNDGNLNTELLLLSFPSTLKPIKKYGLIQPSISRKGKRNEIPRVLNWYCLTTKGKAFFSNYIIKHLLSDETNHKMFIDNIVLKFDKRFLI